MAKKTFDSGASRLPATDLGNCTVVYCVSCYVLCSVGMHLAPWVANIRIEKIDKGKNDR